MLSISILTIFVTSTVMRGIRRIKVREMLELKLKLEIISLTGIIV